MDNLLHLRTQRNQSYGSQRRCCERCGIMIWSERDLSSPTYTDDEQTYLQADNACMYAINEINNTLRPDK